MMIAIELIGLLLLIYGEYRIGSKFSRVLASYLVLHENDHAALLLVVFALITWLFASFTLGGLYAFVFWIIKGV